MAKIVQEISVQEKLYNLYVELLAAEQDKKDLVKAHGENIKRIKAEIKDLLDNEQKDKNELRKDPLED